MATPKPNKPGSVQDFAVSIVDEADRRASSPQPFTSSTPLTDLMLDAINPAEPHDPIERARRMVNDRQRTAYQALIGKQLAATGYGGKGTFMPSALLMRTAGLTSTGAPGIAVENPGLFVHLLSSVVGFNRARHITCTQPKERVVIPGSHAAVSWVAENPGSDSGETSMSLEYVTLTIKTAIAVTSYTKQLLFSSNREETERFVQEDLQHVFREAILTAAINGTDPNAPAGILHHTAIGTTTLGSDGALLTNAALANEHRLVAESDVVTDLEANGAWLTNPKQIERMETIERVADSGRYLLENGRVLGRFPFMSTNAVPKNQTQGTATTICSPLLFGDFSNVLIGAWTSGVDLLIDPFSLAGQAKVRVVGTALVDVAIARPSAFRKIIGAL